VRKKTSGIEKTFLLSCLNRPAHRDGYHSRFLSPLLHQISESSGETGVKPLRQPVKLSAPFRGPPTPYFPLCPFLTYDATPFALFCSFYDPQTQAISISYLSVPPPLVFSSNLPPPKPDSRSLAKEATAVHLCMLLRARILCSAPVILPSMDMPRPGVPLSFLNQWLSWRIHIDLALTTSFESLDFPFLLPPMRVGGLYLPQGLRRWSRRRETWPVGTLFNGNPFLTLMT